MAGQPVLLKDLQLPDAELERLRAAFDFLDKDGDGFIEHAELMAALGELGFHDEHDTPDPTVLGTKKKAPKPQHAEASVWHMVSASGTNPRVPFEQFAAMIAEARGFTSEAQLVQKQTTAEYARGELFSALDESGRRADLTEADIRKLLGSEHATSNDQIGDINRQAKRMLACLQDSKGQISAERFAAIASGKYFDDLADASVKSVRSK